MQKLDAERDVIYAIDSENIGFQSKGVSLREMKNLNSSNRLIFQTFKGPHQLKTFLSNQIMSKCHPDNIQGKPLPEYARPDPRSIL